MSAVGLGFYMSGADDDDPPRRAALIEHTIAAALEAPDAAAADLATAAPDIVADMRSLVALVDDEWRRRVR